MTEPAIRRLPKPYGGPDTLIVGQHRELTGKIRLGTRWFRTVVQHEVLTITTVDYAGLMRREIELEEYVDKREWI